MSSTFAAHGMSPSSPQHFSLQVPSDPLDLLSCVALTQKRLPTTPSPQKRQHDVVWEQALGNEQGEQHGGKRNSLGLVLNEDDLQESSAEVQMEPSPMAVQNVRFERGFEKSESGSGRRKPEMGRIVKKKEKSRSQPSRFCHICSRTSKKVGLMACGNFNSGACRKVVCHKCFVDHKWDWQAAVALGCTWTCTHCRQECPERAQCAIYRRTNERRREQQLLQKSQRGTPEVVKNNVNRGSNGMFQSATNVE